MVRRKLVILAVLCMTLHLGVMGETVSQKEASKIAQLFFNEIKGQQMQKPKLVWTGRKLTTNSLFNPFYVYNNNTGGYVIVSAENKAMPILGYSLTENFDPDRLPSPIKSLLRQYALEIELVRYDSAIPYDAIAAWGDISDYIYKIIHTPADVTDATITIAEADESLNRVADSAKDEFYADIYTPSQWSELIDDEFKRNRSVAVALIEGDDLLPMVVYGKKGEYYRIKTDDGQNDKGKAPLSDSYLRLSVTEMLSPNQVAVLGNPPVIPEIEDIEVPFRFYEDFIAEVEEQQRKINGLADMDILQREPMIAFNGGGHFTISMPENVTLSRIYSLTGGMTQEKYFRNTDTAILDLSAEPSGFYIALLLGESGKPYSLKLYR